MPAYLAEARHSLHLSLEPAMDVPFESADALRNAARFEMIRLDISHRLRKVCVNLTAPDFLLLVNSMVAMQLKGELRKNQFFLPLDEHRS